MDTLTLNDLSVPVAFGANNWNEEGVVYLPGLIPEDLIAAYQREWWVHNGFDHLNPGGDVHSDVLVADRPGGWPDCTPYMRHVALRDIVTYGPLAKALEDTIGEPAGVHLNLTGWVTTERNWHQDTYLNEEEVGDYYAAVWIALGIVHADSGPFQYVPGSHLWHCLKRDLIAPHVDMRDPSWPKLTEDFLTPMVEDEIEARGAEVVTYLPTTGDVLLWHPRLYHRGSKAQVPGAYRPALIAHYSGIHHRPQMPRAVHRLVNSHGGEAGGWMFPIEDSGPSS